MNGSLWSVGLNPIILTIKMHSHARHRERNRKRMIGRQPHGVEGFSPFALAPEIAKNQNLRGVENKKIE